MLADILKQNKVNNSGMRFDHSARTALSFVTLRSDGEREILFYRNPSADMLLRESELDVNHIKQVSGEEISFLTGGDDPNDDDAVLKKLFHPNIKILLVSEGSKGCRYYTKQFKGRVHGVKTKAVDTTGAGDAFVGEILYVLASDVHLYQDEKRLREALVFANACGALAVTQRSNSSHADKRGSPPNIKRSCRARGKNLPHPFC